MKNFNVALLSDDHTFMDSYYFSVQAENSDSAIEIALNRLREVLTGQYDESDFDPDVIESDLLDYTPEVFELVKI